MKKTLKNRLSPATIEGLHFQFENDFIEDNRRCIPMLVRFKLDAAGIKLKLAEWSRLNVEERMQLAIQACSSGAEVLSYRDYLCRLVVSRTGNEPAELPVDPFPAWANLQCVDASLQARAKEYYWYISIAQWTALSNLQRFALLKLYRPGHENKNFPKAMKEFKLA